jgi:hypothetical protein
MDFVKLMKKSKKLWLKVMCDTFMKLTSGDEIDLTNGKNKNLTQLSLILNTFMLLSTKNLWKCWLCSLIKFIRRMGPFIP